jgi:transcriptional regulator with XRE-family HTH domain
MKGISMPITLARPFSDLQPDPAAVLTKATLAAADRLGLSGRQLAVILGVSEPTVSRLKRGDTRLETGTKPHELALILVRVFRALDAITGGDEGVARAWVLAPNLALAARPIDRMVTVQGLVDVAAYLDARRAPL